MQDHYEILQVHPNADQETIQAAYERMRLRYDPAALEDAAEELVEIARKKRDDIERAYAVLGDPVRRATYDEERRALTNAEAQVPADGSEEVLDYRPLPPAGGEERPRSFNAQPLAPRQSAARQSGRRTGAKSVRFSWSTPVAIVGVTTFVVLLVSLFLTTLNSPQPSAASDTESQPAAGGDAQAQQAQLMNTFEDQITEARMVAQQVPDNANAWINLGNILYDSVQIVREQMPESELYEERLPRWIEASEAYREALALDPDNVVVRADLAVSLCKYGEGVDDPAYVEEGLAEAQRAAALDAMNARVRLNLGVCLANTEPPQTEAALEQWYAVLDLPSAEQGELFEAQQLIEQHGSGAAGS